MRSHDKTAARRHKGRQLIDVTRKLLKANAIEVFGKIEQATDANIPALSRWVKEHTDELAWAVSESHVKSASCNVPRGCAVCESLHGSREFGEPLSPREKPALLLRDAQELTDDCLADFEADIKGTTGTYLRKTLATLMGFMRDIRAAVEANHINPEADSVEDGLEAGCPVCQALVEFEDLGVANTEQVV